MSKFLVFINFLIFFSNNLLAYEFSGYAGFSALFFQHEPLYKEQHREQLSLLSQLEFYHSWNEEQDRLLFKPYIRIDQQDKERSHFDIRELVWLHVGSDWELRTGIGKVFWGVNEANHLVDIINQDDWVDDISADPKLGQPMINLSLIKNWGTLDLFVLPGFRERTFTGIEGRLRGPLVINSDLAEYESSKEQRHIDFALRWSHTFEDYDMGIHYFKGTGRDPLIRKKENRQALFPYYMQIEQSGLDFQATLDAWLWKFESIYREDLIDKFFAASGGFEYTFFGIKESVVDLGVIAEYSWDERNDNVFSMFQNDLMLGARLAFNDVQSTEILLGFIQDLDQNSLRQFQIEASRRLGNNWKAELELRIFSGKPYHLFYHEDHLQITLKRYF